MALKWIGHTKGAQGIIGIPARDLNDHEVEQYGGEKVLIDSGLYEKVKPAPSPKVERETDAD